jgi:hypothetical protein
MNSPKTFSGVAAVTLAAATVFATACEQTAPLAPLAPPLALLSADVERTARASYRVTGDCARATVIDSGSVTSGEGMLVRRGAVFDCPLTGDIEGVARVILNLALRNAGTPRVEGRVFGKSIFMVTKFFGRTDLSGTFEGWFNSSLADVRFGQASVRHRGSGDFRGLVLRGIAVQNPPGSGTEVETGVMNRTRDLCGDAAERVTLETSSLDAACRSLGDGDAR